MAARRNESYERLQELVNAWTAEVSEVRTALDQKLTLTIDNTAPAFALRAPARDGFVDDARNRPLGTLVVPGPPVDEIHPGEHRRLQAELEFAREMLEALNGELHDSDQRNRSAVDPVAPSASDIHVLEQQLRQREWALRKAENERELLREDLDRIRSEMALGAQADTPRIVSDDETSRNVLDALNAQLNETSTKLRNAGHEINRLQYELEQRDIDTARLAELEEKYVDAIRTADELKQVADDARAQLDAAREAYEIRLREANENYDALASSHMDLRDEIAMLHSNIVERDLKIQALQDDRLSDEERDNIAALRDELATYQTALVDAEARIRELTDADDALRDERDVLEASLEQIRFEHDLLVQALREEIDALRSVANQREFVANHQQETIDSLERELAAQRRTAQDATAALREKDVLLKGVREDLATLRDRYSRQERHVAVIEAKLDAKDAELARARDRIHLLRGMLPQSTALPNDAAPPAEIASDPDVSAPEEVSVADSEVLADPPRSSIATQRVERGSPPDSMTPPASNALDFSQWQPNHAVQREIEDSVPFEFPWPVVVLAAILAGGGLFTAMFIFILFG